MSPLRVSIQLGSPGDHANKPWVTWRALWVVAPAFLVSLPAPGQDALRNSLAAEAAVAPRQVEPGAGLPYTVKQGDFRLLVNPSLGLDYNDNVRTSKDNAEDDFIIRPMLALNASYPVNKRNFLQLNVTFGYNKYLEHDDLSRWYLQSGSALSFDIYTGDFWINLHDRFSYVQDSAQEAAVANTGSYGTFQNTAGLSATWDLQDVTLTAGYDHLNRLSTDDQFSYTDSASEQLLARAGLRLNPRLVTGLEGTVSFTGYHREVLNDNWAYSTGAYADWRPGSFFSLQPRFGYSIYDFQQTSSTVEAEDQGSWYGGLTVTHQPTDVISYSLSVGHEMRLGIQSDAIEDSYVRPSVTWDLIKDVSLQTSLFYEHGEQSGGRLPGAASESYDWYGGGFGISYSPAKRLALSLNYRLTLRSSDVPSREYSQNLVGLMLTYRPQ